MTTLSNMSAGIGKTFKKIFWRKSVAVVLVILVAAGVYFGYKSSGNGAAAVTYVTQAASKGTVIVSVTGSGQVSVDSQVDVKPQVSGKVISVKVKNGQNVKAGDVIATIDDVEAQKAVRDANINLEDAQISLQKLTQSADQYSVDQARSTLAQAQMDLEKLKEPPTATDLQLAENAVSQAQRSVQQAKDNYDQVGLNAKQTLDKAYDDGYTAVSQAFLEVPDLVKDAYKVQWDSNDDPSDHVYSYKLILGDNSVYISSMIDDYNTASDKFKTSFDDFKTVTRDSGDDAVYGIITETYDMVRAVSTALESARNLLDVIVNMNYKNFFIADTVDSLRTMIQNDITVINKDVTDLTTAKDTIDTTKQNLPYDISDAQAAIDSATESLQEKQSALTDLKAGASKEDLFAAQTKVTDAQNSLDQLLSGADKLDVKAQNLTIEQRQNSLADAKATLDDYTIRAPFNGTISAVGTTVGDTIGSGTSVATLISSQRLADVSLNEVDMVKLKLGQKATLTFDAIDGLSISGEVVDIDTVGTVSQGVVTYNVKVAFDTDDDRVRPGMSVDAAIITDVKQNVLVVPNSAVKTQGATSYVQVMASADSKVPRQQDVVTGLADDTSTEIVSGLNEGDLVVTKTTGASTSGSAAAATGASTAGGAAARGGGGIRIPGFGG